MKKWIFILMSILVWGCYSEQYQDVGDIKFDAQLDRSDFNLCDENVIKQYYIRKSSDTAPGYHDEKRGLEKDILSEYSFPQTESESGYITIRFIVNCKGDSGRFRVEEMDFNYKPKTFDPRVTNQLLDIVKKLNGWTPRKKKNKAYDFYQYLTFKIEAGQITKILP